MNPSKNSPEHSDTDRHLESLSALSDGELDADEARFLLRRLADDRVLQIHWQRVHQVRACIQHEYPGPVSLVDAVRLRLETEPAPSAAQARWRPWLQVGLGGAIAASVAMVAVIGLIDRVDPVDPGAVAAPAFVGQTTALDRQFSRRVEPAGFGGSSREGSAGQLREQQRINRIMIRHSQVAGGSGFISFTPVLAAPTSVDVAPIAASPVESVPVEAAARSGAEPARD